ncbi:MAG: hypothetical protein NTY08_10885 [Proteobacteria bacterium]|nr:hypothetical protein [Pseudomonadota bacterium]
MLHVTLIASLALAISLVGCSSEQGPAKPVLKNSGATSDKLVGLRSTQARNTNNNNQPAGNDGSDDVVQGPVDTSADDAAIAALISDCGFPDGKLPEPTATVFQKSMRSLPVSISGKKSIANYTAVVRATVDVSASMSGAKQNIKVGLESFTSNVGGFIPLGDTGRADAEKQVQANNSSSESVGPSDDERSALLDQAGPWKDIYCTISQTKTLTTMKNGTTKTVSFDPPIPGAMWAKASPSRFKTEIGSGKTFANVTATVTNSSDSTLPAGTKVTGTVSVTPIPGNVSQLKLSTDTAYTIKFDFGAQTTALGLTLSQSFYINTTDKDLKAIVIETGVTDLPQLVIASGL